MFEVIGGKQLLPVGPSLYEYRSKIASFQQLDLSAVPYELQSLLGPMLSVAPAARPSAISITGSQYFQVHLLSTMRCPALHSEVCTGWLAASVCGHQSVHRLACYFCGHCGWRPSCPGWLTASVGACGLLPASYLQQQVIEERFCQCGVAPAQNSHCVEG